MSEPLTITDAAKLIKAGELTPSELLEQCLRRVDIYEHAVKAWVYLDRERARQEAAKFTDEIKKGHFRGPLHGIPIGIKDIIDVFDMPTGCGSKLWANSYARRDATCVSRLRDAGAVIMGKTVTTPYAYLDPPVTRNPWNLERTPGGSSSGSAAAVACAMCLGALGTQTGGSLTRPASYCGVCSFKPKYGVLSLDGVLPLSPTLDHLGMIARCVRDLAVLFETLAGPTPTCIKACDMLTNESDFYHLTGYFDQADEALLDLYWKALRKFGKDRVKELTLPSGFSEVPAAQHTEMAAGAFEFHADRLERHLDEYPPRIHELVKTGQTQTADLAEANTLRSSIRIRFMKWLDDVSFFVTPATMDFAPTPETTGRAAFNSPWSFLEFPTISVPAGFSLDGLPFAVQFIAADDCQEQLLGTTAWAERCFNFDKHLPPIPA